MADNDSKLKSLMALYNADDAFTSNGNVDQRNLIRNSLS